MIRFFGVILCVFGLGQAVARANDLEHAPPAFDLKDGRAVPIDIESIALNWEFSTAAGARAHARVSFRTGESGFPMFDLVPNPIAIWLNGKALPAQSLRRIADPHQATEIRVLAEVVDAGDMNVMEFQYVVPDVTFNNGNVRAGLFMNDLATGGRKFWEQYGPANFEFDQFQQTIDLRLVGVSKSHELFANGAVTETAPNAWRIVFPDYYSSSSFYLHLTEAGRFARRSALYQGLDAEIPVLVYAESASLAASGLTDSLKYFKELEATYGPYSHRSFIAYMTPDGGGMEYAGATMTSLWALGHEITHSWFARGVMPSSGNAGWVDEAVASWRGNGYPRATAEPNRQPVNLGGFSPYRRHTTMDAYTLGAKLMSEFDFMFRQFSADGKTGMRAVLRLIFEMQKNETITVDSFRSQLTDLTGRDVQSVFNRYVYGKGSREIPQISAGLLQSFGSDRGAIDHPRPYTPEELARFR